MVTRRARYWFLGLTGLCALATGTISAEILTREQFPATKVLADARAGGLNPKFELPRSTLVAPEAELTLFHKSKVFDDEICAGVARIESCTDKTCELRFFPTNTVRLFPIKIGEAIFATQVTASPKIIQMMDDGTLPKGPDALNLVKRRWSLSIQKHWASYFYEERPTEIIFNSYKYLRSRAPMSFTEFEAKWWFIGYHSRSAGASLPTKDFFERSILSSLSISSQALFANLSFLTGHVDLRCELGKESQIFLTDNDNDALIPSKTQMLNASLGASVKWPWSFYANSSGAFAVKIGKSFATIGKVMSGSVTDTGNYLRGTSSTVAGTRFIVGHEIYTDSTHWWASLWHVGVQYQSETFSIKFSGDPTPTGYTPETGSAPSSDTLSYYLGKSYEF